MKFFYFLFKPFDDIFEILIEKEFKRDLKFLKENEEIKKKLKIYLFFLRAEEQDEILENYYDKKRIYRWNHRLFKRKICE